MASIKRPDGTSRGFAFVRFTHLDSVDRAIEVCWAFSGPCTASWRFLKPLQAHAQHMIDNKWVDVKRHDNDAHSAGPAAP